MALKRINKVRIQDFTLAIFARFGGRKVNVFALWLLSDVNCMAGQSAISSRWLSRLFKLYVNFEDFSQWLLIEVFELAFYFSCDISGTARSWT